MCVFKLILDSNYNYNYNYKKKIKDFIFNWYIICSGMFYERHLKYIKLNTEFVYFTKMNLTYLLKVRKMQLFNNNLGLILCKVV